MSIGAGRLEVDAALCLDSRLERVFSFDHFTDQARVIHPFGLGVATRKDDAGTIIPGFETGNRLPGRPLTLPDRNVEPTQRAKLLTRRDSDLLICTEF